MTTVRPTFPRIWFIVISLDLERPVADGQDLVEQSGHRFGVQRCPPRSRGSRTYDEVN